MKAFRRDKLTALRLSANRFNLEPEVICKAARAGWRICEVPISYSGLTDEQGKNINWGDRIVAMAAIIYYRCGD
jgi:hypothetical protein